MAFRTRDELEAALPHVISAPKEEGRLDLIVVRPRHGERETPDRVRITAAGGLEGDHWSKGCWLTTEEGAPHPDVQICFMSSRMIRAIAGPVKAWPAAGDNLFVDMDLSPDNLPPGTRIAIGSAEIEITAEPHKGCSAFIERYGRDACVFVNTGVGNTLRLRGIYGRVVRDGEIRRGDPVRKLPA